jgi:hypothetical protein
LKVKKLIIIDKHRSEDISNEAWEKNYKLVGTELAVPGLRDLDISLGKNDFLNAYKTILDEALYSRVRYF